MNHVMNSLNMNSFKGFLGLISIFKYPRNIVCKQRNWCELEIRDDNLICYEGSDNFF
jgi:hypothetical protein